MEHTAQAILATLSGILTTPANALILILSWGLVEAFAPPVEWILARQRWSIAQRSKLALAAKLGKRLAATIWCLGLVWIPGAQPPLCDGWVVADCQTVIERLTVAVVLGLALSLTHNLVARAIKRLRSTQDSLK